MPVSYTHLDVYKRQALALLLLCWKEFKLLSFDRDFGASLGFLLLRPRLGGGTTTEGVTAGEPTPFPDATAPAAGDQAVIVGVSDTGTFTVTLDAPATLGVLDQQRLVQPESIGVDLSLIHI